MDDGTGTGTPIGWMEEFNTEPEIYLTTTGTIEQVNDVFTVRGYNVETGAAIIQPYVSDTSVSDLEISEIQLGAFDVAGLPVGSIAGKAIGDALPEGHPFLDGSVVYAASLIATVDSYRLWCDSDNEAQPIPVGLNCVNFMYIGNDADNLPLAASTLDDIVYTTEEVSQNMASASIDLGEGYDAQGNGYYLNAYFVSTSGLASDPIDVLIVINFFDGGMDFIEPAESIVINTADFGNYPVWEFEVPEQIAKMGNLDDEDRFPFVFLDDGSTFQEPGSIVRQGRKMPMGATEEFFLYNQAALDSIVNDNFNPPMDDGTTTPPPPM